MAVSTIINRNMSSQLDAMNKYRDNLKTINQFTLAIQEKLAKIPSARTLRFIETNEDQQLLNRVSLLLPHEETLTKAEWTRDEAINMIQVALRRGDQVYKEGETIVQETEQTIEAYKKITEILRLASQGNINLQ